MNAADLPIAKRTRRSLSGEAPSPNVKPLKVAVQKFIPTFHNANVLQPLTNTSPVRIPAHHDKVKATKPPLPPEIDDRSRAGSTDSGASKENSVVPQLKQKGKTVGGRPPEHPIINGTLEKKRRVSVDVAGSALQKIGEGSPNYNIRFKAIRLELPRNFEQSPPQKAASVNKVKRRSTAKVILNKLEDFEQDQLANGRVTTDDEEEVETLDEKEKWAVKKALRETKVTAVVKGIDNECRGKGEDVGEYMVHRIMHAEKDKFLVFWFGWNFTGCTWQTLDDLERSPIPIRQYLEKEKGLAAVMEDLEKNQDMFDDRIKFARVNVPFMGKWITDAEVEEKMRTAHFRQRMGYWKVKNREIEWMRILDPLAEHGHPPLYIEHWVQQKYVDVPLFKFITELTFTENAKQLVELSSTVCLKGCICQSKALCEECIPPADDCLMCTITKDGRIEDPHAADISKLGKARSVISCTDNCSCKGPRRREIPKFPRKHPLLVFFDPVKGWTVRALTNFRKGELVSEYLGEVMTADEAHGQDESYNFAIGESLVVNAMNYGNESRFFSHSCEPNMMVVRVYDRGICDPDVFHRMVMVTTRKIKAGEELTFDYHPNARTKMPGDPREANKPSSGYATCKCATAICRMWL